MQYKPDDSQGKWQDSFVHVPISDTWTQHDIVNLEIERKRIQCQKHEQVPTFDLSAKAQHKCKCKLNGRVNNVHA